MNLRRLLPLVVAATVFGAGCSDMRVPFDLRGLGLGGGSRSSYELPPPGEPVESFEGVTTALPWETWSNGLDLNNAPLTNPKVREGDEYVADGLRDRALTRYLTVNINTLSAPEREALMLRVAGTELSLGRPQEALSRLSRFFRARRIEVDRVPSEFAIVLGYAYGQTGNVEQSLAWFSRADARATGRTNSRAIAEEGVRWALRSVPEQRFEEIAQKWAGDPFVQGLFGQERRRRASGAGRVNIATSNVGGDAGGRPLSSAGGPTVVGVLLPLTGEYAALGRSTKNGIELGFSAQRGVALPEFADTGRTNDQALTATDRLVDAARADLLLGPLLSEQANVVSDRARSRRVPIVTFSKRENSPLGGGVFRLGVTASSQAETLANVASRRLNVRQVGVVASNDTNGRELARQFVNAATSAGMRVVFERYYEKGGEGDLLNLAREIEQISPQALFVGDNVRQSARLLSLLPNESLKKMQLFGPASWDNKTELTQSGRVFDGAIFVSPFFAASSRPLVKNFVETYRQRFGAEPDFLAAQGFDAAMLVSAALRQGRERGMYATNALEQVERYEGLTGDISVESSGEMHRRYAVVEFRGGQLRDVVDAAAGFGRTSPPVDVNAPY